MKVSISVDLGRNKFWEQYREHTLMFSPGYPSPTIDRYKEGSWLLYTADCMSKFSYTRHAFGSITEYDSPHTALAKTYHYLVNAK